MPLRSSNRIILASGSEIRATLLRNAGLDPEICPARVDEDAVRASFLSEGAKPRDLADALAELKACKISARTPTALVLGADQILSCDGRIFTKPESRDEARSQLSALGNRTHVLHSALVAAEGGQAIWRHVGQARMTMRDLSAAYIADYVDRNWDRIRHSVGCYQLESEGVRLFSRIEGDYFTVLGLPLIELLTWLGIRGDIAT